MTEDEKREETRIGWYRVLMAEVRDFAAANLVELDEGHLSSSDFYEQAKKKLRQFMDSLESIQDDQLYCADLQGEGPSSSVKERRRRRASDGRSSTDEGKSRGRKNESRGKTSVDKEIQRRINDFAMKTKPCSVRLKRLSSTEVTQKNSKTNESSRRDSKKKFIKELLGMLERMHNESSGSETSDDSDDYEEGSQSEQTPEGQKSSATVPVDESSNPSQEKSPPRNGTCSQSPADRLRVAETEKDGTSALPPYDSPSGEGLQDLEEVQTGSSETSTSDIEGPQLNNDAMATNETQKGSAYYGTVEMETFEGGVVPEAEDIIHPDVAEEIDASFQPLDNDGSMETSAASTTDQTNNHVTEGVEPPDVKDVLNFSGTNSRRNVRSFRENLLPQTEAAVKKEVDRNDRVMARDAQLEQILQLSQDDLPEEISSVLDFHPVTAKPAVIVDPTLIPKLKSYQLKGIKFMYDNCYESLTELLKPGSEGSGCVLAHCMGLGKTFQAVSFVHTVMTCPEMQVKSVLVLCPVNVVQNWVIEFHHWLNDCEKKIKIYNLLEVKDQQRIKFVENWYERGGVLISSYGLYRSTLTLTARKNDAPQDTSVRWKHILLDPGPDLVVCDEGHLLKDTHNVLVPLLGKIRTKRRVILTGTPIQNNLMEYYTMVNFVKPNLLGSPAEFRNGFANPIKKGQNRDSTIEDVKLMKKRSFILHKLLEPCVQRLGYPTLINLLPPKHEYAIVVHPSALQKKLYNGYLRAIGPAYARLAKNKFLGDYTLVSKILSHPANLTYSNAKKTKSNKKKLGDSWWQSISGGEEMKKLEHSNKLTLLLDIISNSVAQDEKLLVFSQHKYTLDFIQSLIESNKINGQRWQKGEDFLRLDGDVVAEKRQAMVDEFNEANSRVKVFLLSTEAGGVGINLVSANRVVIFDASYNPAKDLQAMFRAYRLGQVKPCYVYRLITGGTMEETIYRNQVNKLSLAERVMDEQNPERHFKEDEFVNIYAPIPEELPSAHDLEAPEDTVLGTLLARRRELIQTYLDHKDLLENQEEDDLTDADRQAAWQEYEELKESLRSSDQQARGGDESMENRRRTRRSRRESDENTSHNVGKEPVRAEETLAELSERQRKRQRHLSGSALLQHQAADSDSDICEVPGPSNPRPVPELITVDSSSDDETVEITRTRRTTGHRVNTKGDGDTSSVLPTTVHSLSPQPGASRSSSQCHSSTPSHLGSDGLPVITGVSSQGQQHNLSDVVKRELKSTSSGQTAMKQPATSGGTKNSKANDPRVSKSPDYSNRTQDREKPSNSAPKPSCQPNPVASSSRNSGSKQAGPPAERVDTTVQPKIPQKTTFVVNLGGRKTDSSKSTMSPRSKLSGPVVTAVENAAQKMNSPHQLSRQPASLGSAVNNDSIREKSDGAPKETLVRAPTSALSPVASVEVEPNLESTVGQVEREASPRSCYDDFEYEDDLSDDDATAQASEAPAQVSTGTDESGNYRHCKRPKISSTADDGSDSVSASERGSGKHSKRISQEEGLIAVAPREQIPSVTSAEAPASKLIQLTTNRLVVNVSSDPDDKTRPVSVWTKKMIRARTHQEPEILLIPTSSPKPRGSIKERLGPLSLRNDSTSANAVEISNCKDLSPDGIIVTVRRPSVDLPSEQPCVIVANPGATNSDEISRDVQIKSEGRDQIIFPDRKNKGRGRSPHVSPRRHYHRKDRNDSRSRRDSPSPPRRNRSRGSPGPRGRGRGRGHGPNSWRYRPRRYDYNHSSTWRRSPPPRSPEPRRRHAPPRERSVENRSRSRSQSPIHHPRNRPRRIPSSEVLDLRRRSVSPVMNIANPGVHQSNDVLHGPPTLTPEVEQARPMSASVPLISPPVTQDVNYQATFDYNHRNDRPTLPGPAYSWHGAVGEDSASRGYDPYFSNKFLAQNLPYFVSNAPPQYPTQYPQQYQ